MIRQRVLFLCTHNSARSQIAEGLLRHKAGELFEVMSAGTEKTAVRPEAIEVMGEIGIDISGHRSKTLDQFRGVEFDRVITVCDDAAEACPTFPGTAQRIHWPLPDPGKVAGGHAERLEAFRRVRNQLDGLIEDFIASTSDHDSSARSA